MPLLHITTQTLPAADVRGTIAKQLSKLVAHELGKPEAYVMIALSQADTMLFAGTPGPALYAELKNVGEFSAEDTERLSAILCDALANAFAVPKDRIYIEFGNADGDLWGWNGGTF